MVMTFSAPGTSEDTDANASGVDSNNIPITEEEYEALVRYTPQENEWPDEPYDTAVERLTRGLSLISELPFAGPFAYPVDVRSYPDYWSVVAYPMDLKAIIDRLSNQYYRYLKILNVSGILYLYFDDFSFLIDERLLYSGMFVRLVEMRKLTMRKIARLYRMLISWSQYCPHLSSKFGRSLVSHVMCCVVMWWIHVM